MQIDLSQEIEDHFERLKALAEEAASDDGEEKLSSRAAAMSALSSILRELTKTQAEVINMQRMQNIERITIEVLKEWLPEDKQEELLNRLEELLDA